MPMAAARRKVAAVSSTLHLENGRGAIIAQSTTTGATIKLAAASARHQVAQVDSQVHTASAVQVAGSEKLASSVRIDPATATIEPMIAVGTRQTSANFAAPIGA